MSNSIWDGKSSGAGQKRDGSKLPIERTQVIPVIKNQFSLMEDIYRYPNCN